MHRGLLDSVVDTVVQGEVSSPRRTELLSLAVAPVAALGFWASVALPATYIPLFLTGVVDAAFAAHLLALHAFAVVVGHSHGQ
ncbi:hypothetical protein [Halorarius litoreus]|uniref:hypothetical protein n=1 Tax=Halorarius litoreus TaxID=2962676 RepID=UPI0020CDFCF5|nr:hypothetical protein [Halorarius litoreus]